MDLNLFHYIYPKELIAQQPLPERDQSRMMALDRGKQSWEHRTARDFPDYLRAGDLLVINDTKVFPARLLGSNGVEILLFGKSGEDECWRALAKPFKKIRVGDEIFFAEDFFGRVAEKNEGEISIQLFGGGADGNLTSLIEKYGLPPLPPYIRRKTAADYTANDRERYQSIFARQTGSAAAPTASLHFSNALMEKIRVRGVEIATVTLHVSTDTFLPIRADDITQHKMHGECFFISKETQEKIRRAKSEGRRVIAVGTTVVRALESDWSQTATHLYITPGFRFKIVDGLLTNFHQPESTLIVLVSAFAGLPVCRTGREFLLRAYAEAIQQRYRLFSYGDCMLIHGPNRPES